jgi:hypothetical protein
LDIKIFFKKFSKDAIFDIILNFDSCSKIGFSELDLSANSPEIKGKSRTNRPSPIKKFHFLLVFFPRCFEQKKERKFPKIAKDLKKIRNSKNYCLDNIIQPNSFILKF